MPDYKQLTRRKASLKKGNKIVPKRRKSLKKVVLLLIFCVLIISVYLGTRPFLLNFSGFKIDKVSIIDHKGEALQDPERIFRLESRASLFSFDIKGAARDIQARHPEFASVVIHKQFPNTLLIIIKNRDPVAVVVRKKSNLVDKEGFILPFKSTYQHLPKIIGIASKEIRLYAKSSSLKLSKALELLKELEKAKIYPQYNITQIDLRQIANQNIIFHLEIGTEVKMGQSEFARKAALLKRILSQLEENNTVPEYIDMRFDNPTVLP